MNYNYLRYFSVLAKLQHYTAAADQLGITQPALSSAIRHLENELGVKLFEKVGRNIRLTEQGQYYYSKVEESLDILHTANQTLISSREEAPVVIRIGFVSGMLGGKIAASMVKYQQQERCGFLLTEGSAPDLLELLRQEKLDVAIVDISSRDRNLFFQHLGSRDLCVAMPKDHPLSGHAALTTDQLSEYPQIGLDHSKDHLDEWSTPPDDKSSYSCQINTVAGALDLVRAGLGIAVIPQESQLERPDIVYIPLKNRHQALYATILYNRWLDPPIWNFVKQAINTVRGDMQ